MQNIKQLLEAKTFALWDDEEVTILTREEHAAIMALLSQQQQCYTPAQVQTLLKEQRELCIKGVRADLNITNGAEAAKVVRSTPLVKIDIPQQQQKVYTEMDMISFADWMHNVHLRFEFKNNRIYTTTDMLREYNALTASPASTDAQI